MLLKDTLLNIVASVIAHTIGMALFIPIVREFVFNPTWLAVFTTWGLKYPLLSIGTWFILLELIGRYRRHVL